MDTGRVIELAGSMSAAFVVAQRADGTQYRKLREGAAEWITDVIYRCHGDMLPDDWRYQIIEHCADAVSEAGGDDEDSLRESAMEILDSVTPVNLTGWLASHAYRPGYCDEAIEEGIAGADLFSILSAGWYLELREVMDALLGALSDVAEEQEAEAAAL